MRRAPAAGIVPNMYELRPQQGRTIRQELPLRLADCPKGFVPVMEEGETLHFVPRQIYVDLVTRGMLMAQSVH
jgi:hypothetical protein